MLPLVAAAPPFAFECLPTSSPSAPNGISSISHFLFFSFFFFFFFLYTFSAMLKVSLLVLPSFTSIATKLSPPRYPIAYLVEVTFFFFFNTLLSFGLSSHLSPLTSPLLSFHSPPPPPLPPLSLSNKGYPVCQILWPALGIISNTSKSLLRIFVDP